MKYLYILISLFVSLQAYDKTSEYGIKLTAKIEKMKEKTDYIEPIVLKDRLERYNNKENIYILDVRETNEVNPEGYIKTKNYVNIPRGLVEFKMEQNISDLGAEIVVVCYSELRSLFVAKTLRELGYKRILVLRGGMEKWNKECLPKEHSSNLFFKEDKKGSCGGTEESEKGFSFIRQGTSIAK